MFEVVAWFATHPTSSEEANIVVWLAVICGALMFVIFRWLP